jgi:hypothetical protein
MSSGSENRRRGKIIRVRVDDKEAAALAALADAHRQSLAALVRNSLLNIPLPRVHRPRINEPLFGKALARLAALTAELGKEGSNLNQLTHYVNAERPIGTLVNSLESCLQNIDMLHRDAFELRTLFVNAMGLERARGGDNSEDE